MGMMMAPAVVTATDRYVFVLRGNTLFQFDVNGLRLLAQTQLPGGGGQGGGGAGGSGQGGTGSGAGGSGTGTGTSSGGGTSGGTSTSGGRL
jgi:hypothetical protein